jgi:hypothetical protein
MEKKRGMTIFFNDGSKISVDYPVDNPTPTNITAQIQGLLKDQYLLVEVDSALLMFPFHNIKYIQVYPAPDPLPSNVIRGASMGD